MFLAARKRKNTSNVKRNLKFFDVDFVEVCTTPFVKKTVRSDYKGEILLVTCIADALHLALGDVVISNTNREPKLIAAE